jgi:diguanylate cyclase (GGDEF)-like protein
MDFMSDEAIRGALEAIWEQSRESALETVALLEQTAATLAASQLSDDDRRVAAQAANHLATAVGAFGFWNASALVREIGVMLEEPGLTSADAPRLASLALQLREGLEDEATIARAVRAASRLPSARVLVIGDDPDFRDRLANDSRSLGFEIIGAETPAAARARLAGPVDAVLLDLSLPGTGMEFLAELRTDHPDVMAVVLSSGDRLDVRLQAARLGARAFLQKPVRATQVVDVLRELALAAAREAPTIVAVHEGDARLANLGRDLEPIRGRVVSITDPLSVLSGLAETSPDLVVLDADTRQLDALELCRVLRNDPRWGAVPVLFLTASTDPDLARRLFECGGDDVVAKASIESELVGRVRNRLERTRMLRLAANVDSLTGVATRRRGAQVLDRFFKLASRQRQPISIAVVDLDQFKLVNDRYGHAIGDAVLRMAATILAGCFRGEDVVARWGGEEFVVGMYSISCAAAARRLEQALVKLRAEHFDTARGEFFVTFSAGIAEFPRDGEDWTAVFHVADEALARAKAQGRGRVVAAGVDDGQ